MSTQAEKKPRKRNIVVYFYMILILFSLTSVATYTWFSLSQTPRVSDMNLYVNTQSGFELALTPDAEEWVYQLDFLDMVDVTTPLRPVTWSEQNQLFFAAEYGIDGRLTGQWEALSDERNANKDNLDGYYIKASFYARSGQPVTVSLSPAVEVEEGVSGSGTYLIGTPVWNGEQILHDNGGQNAENAVRIGIRITPVDETGAQAPGEIKFYIYEPNCDTHLDGTTGYVPTPSIDGTSTLIGDDSLILQTGSTWTEAYPVQRDVVVRELGEFLTPTELFALEAGELVRIDVYVWLEGQDVDCTNQITGAQIIASLQFAADAGSQSGMVPIS